MSESSASLDTTVDHKVLSQLRNGSGRIPSRRMVKSDDGPGIRPLTLAA